MHSFRSNRGFGKETAKHSSLTVETLEDRTVPATIADPVHSDIGALIRTELTGIEAAQWTDANTTALQSLSGNAALQNLDTLAKAIVPEQNDVKFLEQRTNVLHDTLVSLDAPLTGLMQEKTKDTADLASLNQSLTSAQNDIASLNTRLTQIGQSVSALSKELADAPGSIQKNTTEIAALNKEIVSLTKSKDTVQKTIATLEKQVSTNVATETRLRQALTTLKVDPASPPARPTATQKLYLTQYQTAVNATKASQSTLATNRTQLSGIQTRITADQNRVTALTNDNTRLQGRIIAIPNEQQTLLAEQSTTQTLRDAKANALPGIQQQIDGKTAELVFDDTEMGKIHAEQILTQEELDAVASAMVRETAQVKALVDAVVEVMENIKMEEQKENDPAVLKMRSTIAALNTGTQITGALALPFYQSILNDADQNIASAQAWINELNKRTPHDNDWQNFMRYAQSGLNQRVYEKNYAQNAVTNAQNAMRSSATELPEAPQLQVIGINKNKLVLQAYAAQGKQVEAVVSWDADKWGIREVARQGGMLQSDNDLFTIPVVFSGTMGGSVSVTGSRKYLVELLVDGQKVNGQSFWIEWSAGAQSLNYVLDSFPSFSAPPASSTQARALAAPIATDQVSALQEESKVLAQAFAPDLQPISFNYSAITSTLPDYVWGSSGMAKPDLDAARKILMQSRYPQFFVNGERIQSYVSNVENDAAGRELEKAFEELKQSMVEYFNYLIDTNAGKAVTFDMSRLQKNYPLFPSGADIATSIKTHMLQIYNAMMGQKQQETAYLAQQAGQMNAKAPDTRTISDAAYQHNSKVIAVAHSGDADGGTYQLARFAMSVVRPVNVTEISALTGKSVSSVNQVIVSQFGNSINDYNASVANIIGQPGSATDSAATVARRLQNVQTKFTTALQQNPILQAWYSGQPQLVAASTQSAPTPNYVPGPVMNAAAPSNLDGQVAELSKDFNSWYSGAMINGAPMAALPEGYTGEWTGQLDKGDLKKITFEVKTWQVITVDASLDVIMVLKDAKGNPIADVGSKFIPAGGRVPMGTGKFTQTLSPGKYSLSLFGNQQFAGAKNYNLKVNTIKGNGAEIIGTVELPFAGKTTQVSMNNAEFTDQGSRKNLVDTQKINPAKPTWFIIHGRTGNDGRAYDDDNDGFVDEKADQSMLLLAKDTYEYAQKNNQQVITIDWHQGADDNYFGLGALQDATWTPVVGNWVGNMLISQGFNPAYTFFIGHSHGTYVAYFASETIHNLTKQDVQSIVALDPASNVKILNGAKLVPADEIDFSKYTSASVAVKSSLDVPLVNKAAEYTLPSSSLVSLNLALGAAALDLIEFGSDKRALTADFAYEIRVSGELNPANAHNYPVTAFAHMMQSWSKGTPPKDLDMTMLNPTYITTKKVNLNSKNSLYNGSIAVSIANELTDDNKLWKQAWITGFNLINA